MSNPIRSKTMFVSKFTVDVISRKTFGVDTETRYKYTTVEYNLYTDMWNFSIFTATCCTRLFTTVCLQLYWRTSSCSVAQWWNPESCKSFHCTPNLCNWPTTGMSCVSGRPLPGANNPYKQPTLFSCTRTTPGCCFHLRSEWCYQILRERERESRRSKRLNPAIAI